jgi:hypothetical protein
MSKISKTTTTFLSAAAIAAVVLSHAAAARPVPAMCGSLPCSSGRSLDDLEKPIVKGGTPNQDWAAKSIDPPDPD